MHRKRGQHPGDPHPNKPWLPDTPGHQNNGMNENIKNHLEEQLEKLRQELGIPSTAAEIQGSSGEQKG